MAVEMERILGAPPLVMSEEEEIARFRKIAEAPRDLDRLLENDAAVTDLVSRLKEVGAFR